jgi:protein gp37
MSTTSIEWTDRTVNPIRARNVETGAVGHYCEKVSPGCTHCYASTWNTRVRPSGTKLIGTGLAFDVRNRDRVEFFLDESKLDDVLRRKLPTTWFWCDMTDLFGDWVPDEWIDRCYAVMALTPHHTHQILTKRARRMREYFTAADLYDRVLSAASDIRAKRPRLTSIGISDPALHPPRWIHKGVSAEDQPSANERIPELMMTPSAVRFISGEPLLGAVSLKSIRWETPGCGGPAFVDVLHGTFCTIAGYDLQGPRLDWVIVGGESGSKARPCAMDWIEDVVRQCQAASVPVFVKQLGAYVVSEERTAPVEMMSGPPEAYRHHRAPNGEVWAWRAGLKDRKGGDPEEWPEELRVRQMPEARA